MRPAALAVASLFACCALAACGGADNHARGAASRGADALTPSADPAATKVVRAWADALRHGHIDRAAALFALPSRVQLLPDGPLEVVALREDAVAFNLALPCGGRLVKATQRGRYVDALFLLSDRPGSACDAPGATARAAFLIRDGRIAEWRRVGAEPGDERYEKRKSPRVGPVV
jgi:hypothetical protein